MKLPIGSIPYGESDPHANPTREIRIGVRVTQDDLDLAKHLAERDGITVSDLVRQLIRQHARKEGVK